MYYYSQETLFTHHIPRNTGGPREVLGFPRSSGGLQVSKKLEGVLRVPECPGVPGGIRGSRDWVLLDNLINLPT